MRHQRAPASIRQDDTGPEPAAQAFQERQAQVAPQEALPKDVHRDDGHLVLHCHAHKAWKVTGVHASTFGYMLGPWA